MTQTQAARCKRKFLDHFRVLGNVTGACAHAGIKRRPDVYDWQRDDAEFAAAFQVAEVEATEHLEAEARRRAVEGLARKKFTRAGEPIMDPVTGQQYVEHEYSDTLLITLLKARAPEKYRERSDVQVNAMIDDGSGLSDDERATRLAALLDAARARRDRAAADEGLGGVRD